MSFKYLPILFLFTIFSAPLFANAPGVQLDGIAAVVDEEVILHSDVARRLRTVRAGLARSANPEPPLNVLREQILERLILERVQLQRAERVGITVSEDQLNQAISNIASGNGMTLDQLVEALANDGISFAEMRDDVRADIIMTQLRQREVLARINVSPREVDAFLAGEGAEALDGREFRVQHIMLRVDPDAEAAEANRVRALGEDIVQRARAGEDFGGLAVAYSTGQQALEGGDLGWRRSTQLPAVFAESVVSMQPGAVSDLIRTPGALHVIKLAESRNTGQRMVVDQVRARHILIRTNPLMTDARAAARLAELRQEILAGGDFGDLARRHSEDPNSAINNGELGWVGAGETVPAFDAAITSLTPGEVSEPFASEYGWHIVQVMERRAHDGTDQMRIAQARRVLRERKAEEELEQWLLRLRGETYIENRLGG
ncbi:MAG: peptidylprolyl isomerase [Xanthomonadaceae bacterium]|nr:peptidylprolyl isomerase [Xanthomonadaceae bacterium]